MLKRLFNFTKTLIPKISNTELIALRTGNTCIDREIYCGKVTLPNLKPIFNNNLDTEVSNLIKKFGNSKVFPSENTNDIIKYLGENKFFSFIINKKYGGLNLSTSSLSSVLTKISSINPALGVTVMVPNSLGPGELLQEYGTIAQKLKYLPGLVNGEYIPCFGLTGPNNGSDAVGSIDKGIVKYENGKRIIEVNINKRYITLAPISNLVGIAFNLSDPDNLLEKGSEGITLALIADTHPGLIKNTHHNPLNAGFPNGTLKGQFKIDIDDVIGGEEMIGSGWKMLMECLAAGRAVCLPATALASSKVSCLGVYNYSKHRRQFGIPLIKMEGVNEKLLEMFYQTWVIQCSVNMTNTLLDYGNKPAVISALMKQQTTERGRKVIENGMDILGGSAICDGPNNFIERFYRSAPIGITVEGSNTLTRSLIIFGQGLNKSHPYIFPIFNSILNNDEKDFNLNMIKMIQHSVSLYIKSLLPNKDLLAKQTIQFANLSNLIALKGGKLKKEQYLSGDLADIFSNIYLAYSVRWYNKIYNVDDEFTKYCVDKLLKENNSKFANILHNENNLSKLLFFYPKNNSTIDYHENRHMLNIIQNNPKIEEHISKDIYFSDILSNLKKLNDLKIDSIEYEELYNKIISVGEYKN